MGPYTRKPKRLLQYTTQADQRRMELALDLRVTYGFTWPELVKLTGMKLRPSTLLELESYA